MYVLCLCIIFCESSNGSNSLKDKKFSKISFADKRKASHAGR